MIRLQLEKLAEKMFLATGDDVQGRTQQETVEIARDVAKKWSHRPTLAVTR
jgi:hypothetical protein